MSFILDALKKSESDRQRQGGPALFEVKVAPPRNPLPPWAVAIAVLFVANLGVVGWLLLPHAAPPAESAAPTRAGARAEAAPPTTAASLPAAVPAAAVPVAPVAAKAAASGVPPAASPPTRSASNVPAAAPPAADEDDAPAEEPPPAGSLGRVKRGTEAGVPLYQQLAAGQGSQLPQLRLDLHAYAEHATDRWVLINMHKLHEGDSLEGVQVERITPEGAVLSYQGTQFLLTRE
jgi:general secretion pathway protein B